MFPRQVHGSRVVEAEACGALEAAPGDVILCSPGGPSSVGVVTADCVPILVASEDGSHVAAIHAGWRGLAAGVIEAGFEAFRKRVAGKTCLAAVGPAARSCCYEVDEPVRQALEIRYAGWLEAPILIPGRIGHYQLDLPLLASRVIESSGLDPARIGSQHRVCSVCDPERFESYRREGVSAGRLRHFISRREPGQARVDSSKGRP